MDRMFADPRAPQEIPHERIVDLPDRLLDLLPVAVCVCDCDGLILRYNRRAVELWLRAPQLADPVERFCGSQRMYHPDGRPLPHPESPMAEVLRTGVSIRDREVAIERPNDSRAVALVNVDAIKNDLGTIVGGVNCLQDITDRKRLEADLRKSQEDLEDFFENAAVAMHWVGADGIILRANQAELDLLGYEREEYVGRHIAEFHADRAIIDGILERLSRGQKIDKYPSKLRAKNGAIRHVIISSNVQFRDGEFVHSRCVTLDVTAERAAETMLRESEARFGAIVSQATAGIAETDVTGRFVHVNERYCQMVGYTKAELSRMRMEDITHPEDLPRNLELFQRLVQTGTDFMIEKRYLRKDGSVVWVNNSVSAVKNSRGQVVNVVAVSIDISERKQAEDQRNLLLREMNHRVKNLFAVTAGLITMSARSVHTPADLATVVQARLGALARAHELVRPSFAGAGQSVDRPAKLDALLEAVFSPFIELESPDDCARVTFGGPDVPIGPNAATSLALVFHELATNAAKYGALSTAEGSVEIDWSLQGNQLCLKWEERNGPAIEGPPTEAGFGSLLARRTVDHQLRGHLSHVWRREGLIIHLTALAEALTS